MTWNLVARVGLEALKLLVVTILISGILSFSTIGFVSVFVRFDPGHETILRYLLHGLSFALVLGVLLYGRYARNRRPRSP